MISHILTQIYLQIYTSRKKGFRPGRIVALVPVALRTGTNVISGSHTAHGAAGFSHQLGLKGLASDATL